MQCNSGVGRAYNLMQCDGCVGRAYNLMHGSWRRTYELMNCTAVLGGHTS